jgi:uncharacterized membrane protein YqjE
MPESTGLIESSKRVAGTLLAILQTRLALLSNEIEEERLRVGQMVFYASIALFFFGLSIMLLTALVVVVFWDDHRLLVMGLFAALYFVTGLLLWNALRRAAQQKPVLFSASLAELSDDRDRLADRL